MILLDFWQVDHLLTSSTNQILSIVSKRDISTIKLMRGIVLGLGLGRNLSDAIQLLLHNTPFSRGTVLRCLEGTKRNGITPNWKFSNTMFFLQHPTIWDNIVYKDDIILQVTLLTCSKFRIARTHLNNHYNIPWCPIQI